MRVPPLVGVMLLVVAMTGACRQREEPREAEGVPPATAPSPAPAAPESAVPGRAIGEDLSAARTELEKKNADASAGKLRDAAGRLIMLAGAASGDAQKALMTASGELEGIATDVQAGAIRDVAGLDRALAAAETSLARYHLSVAQQELQRGDMQAAGRDLSAAAGHIASAGRGVGHAVGKETEKAIRDAEELGAKLTEGVKAAPGDVERMMRDLGREVDKLGAEVPPRKR